MVTTARKLSFQEAWESMTVFFVDEGVEREIDQEVERLVQAAERCGITGAREASAPALGSLLGEDRALELVLHEIELSQEKFLRIVSLLRRIGRIEPPLETE